jgi:heme exporter protein C
VATGASDRGNAQGGRSWHRFANPARFQRMADAVLPWSAGAAALLLTVGLTWGLAFAPADYQQHDSVRIMYVHVPAAWMAMSAYAGLALASAFAIVWRHPLADLAAKATAPVGAAFTFVALVTGALWGQPTWGTWWVWDARLTSVLILLFLYLGYMALWQAFDDPARAARSAAILALVGVVNLPIIKFSVDWWNTLHQPASVMRIGTPAIHESMLWPLLIAAAGFLALLISVVLVGIKAELAERRLQALQGAVAGARGAVIERDATR